MAERTQIPGAHIPNSAACGQWETLLTDALDGLLAPEDEATFKVHMEACPACAALYEEARRGREWLEFLSPEPEIPADLVDRILAQTGPGRKAAHPVMAGGGAMALPSAGMPAWQRPGFMGFVRRWAEPRLMMTAAMAFFSVALTLNLTGVRLSQIRLSDLRPTAVRSFMERQLNMASVPIIRYYDHLRLVYEVQSRMRQLRGDNDETPQQSPAQPAGAGQSKQNHKDGGSRVERPRQSRRPVQANSTYDPNFLDTSFKAATLAPGSEGGMGQMSRGRGNETYLQQGNRGKQGNRGMKSIRAFRWLQNPATRKASERGTIWTA